MLKKSLSAHSDRESKQVFNMSTVFEKFTADKELSPVLITMHYICIQPKQDYIFIQLLYLVQLLAFVGHVLCPGFLRAVHLLSCLSLTKMFTVIISILKMKKMTLRKFQINYLRPCNLFKW